MSKKGIARKGADKKTVAVVEDVLAMAAKNRYSVSKIFAAHNAVFELKEQAQSCASCLTTRVSALRKWYGEAAPVDNPEAYRNAVLGQTSATQTTGKVNVAHNPKTGNALVNEAAAAQDVELDYLDPTHPNHVAPAKGVTRYPMGEGLIPFDFTPSKDDALKGTVKGADGSNVKAGTYTAADGTTIAVSVGNKATIKDDLI